MDITETTRLASALNHLRPDWPHASLVTFITKELSARAYRDAAVALVYVACDPDTQTPKRVLEHGPWWDAVAAAAGREPATPTNDRLDGPCRKCGLWVVRGEDHTCARRAGQATVAAARAAVREGARRG